MIASIAMLIYIIGDMGGVFVGWGNTMGGWWSTITTWVANIF